jgi:hypothetical protein
MARLSRGPPARRRGRAQPPALAAGPCARPLARPLASLTNGRTPRASARGVLPLASFADISIVDPLRLRQLSVCGTMAFEPQLAKLARGGRDHGAVWRGANPVVRERTPAHPADGPDPRRAADPLARSGCEHLAAPSWASPFGRRADGLWAPSRQAALGQGALPAQGHRATGRARNLNQPLDPRPTFPSRSLRATLAATGPPDNDPKC